jgi:hypothetical protein
MMRLAAVLLVLALLAGCPIASAPGRVSQAVEVPCEVSLPPRPVFPVDRLTGVESVFEIGAALWADRQARRAYELQLETALAGCAKP